MATSAGGLEALRAVLDALPADFSAAVVVMQHLGRYGSALVDVLAAHSRLPVRWVEDGTALKPGCVFVCPPQRRVEIRRDRTCVVSEGVRRATDLPIDTLFASLADARGARAIGVVLTGMGRDGAAGVRALDRAGATVIAQSAESARYASMPLAAAATGGVDLVLPLTEIGAMLARVAAGGLLPRSRAETDASAALFTGPGAMRVGPVLADVDWTVTPLGPVLGWSIALRTVVRIVLASPVPMTVYWGPQLVQIYNDAALRHRDGASSRSLGHPARTTRSRAGRAAVATCERVARTRETVWAEHRDAGTAHGENDPIVTLSSYSVILDPTMSHGVGGVFDVVTSATPP
ncbi:MAG TPA: chemotaxis protein CheB [Gemmatirosa sp.]